MQCDYKSPRIHNLVETDNGFIINMLLSDVYNEEKLCWNDIII